MRVLVDDRALTTEAMSIAEAFAAARLDAERQGRVVVDVTLDGEPLSSAEVTDPPDAPSEAREMRFTTADPAELVGSTLLGVAQSLEDVKSEQVATAELLTLGRMSEAMDRLTEALRTWDALRQAVIDGTTLLGLSVETLRIPTETGEKGLADQVKSLANCLTEVKRAFSAQDWSGLADAMQYDLTDQADQWKEVLIGLADLARQGPTPPGPGR